MNPIIFGQNLTPEDQAVLDRLVAVRQQLATLTFNRPESLPLEQYRAQLVQLETEAEALDKTLARRSAVFRAETQPVEIATVQAQLPADGVLVEYVRYRPFDAKANLANRWGEAHYAAYLLFPDGRLEAVDLGDAAEIDAAIGSFTGAGPTPAGGVENPLLRSGLALAGFNPRSSGSADGVFTALEAANLNLVGTQLVVLSACETGLGDIANGEGVYGLRRAFALAGADTQLMSLWQVSDFGTQRLMARYYQKLMAGMGRSEALRAVQLDMIDANNQYSHPYYWAAFILTGDWRPLE